MGRLFHYLTGRPASAAVVESRGAAMAPGRMSAPPSGGTAPGPSGVLYRPLGDVADVKVLPHVRRAILRDLALACEEACDEDAASHLDLSST